MSYKATNWAYDLPLTGSAKGVLVALADMADEENSCYPGQKKLADMTGRSQKTIERALKYLESVGLLERIHRHSANGWRTSDRYLLKLDVTEIIQSDILPTSQVAYKAESLQGTVSSQTDTLSQPNRQGDGAEENHQVNHQLEPSGVAETAKPPRGKRLSDSFEVTPEMVVWAKTNAPLVDGKRSTAKFMNHFTSLTGRGSTKLNWVKAWENWLTTDQERAELHRPRLTPTERAMTTLSLATDIDVLEIEAR
ncbi:helix-turn-helix domain-containing protein [Subtercola sp. PAMC28395]|uniref:helix-turn-helix domain-containing protein n=1 Tax=Subtercola sp. PAMC28395 TaxID=2846775 RepID=UPI001C0CA543|nr:helix-turn-helix domain-containing protein [Subtercola sp. PAMC28395]QWT24961.1 helix-turn-helix domain-containing protein [Subtercola sp. PAMC28395]